MSIKQSTGIAAEVNGARDCLLHGVRANGVGLGVLTIDDNAFHDMMESDDDYRAMMVELLKLMFTQAGYDATCAALAEKARKKIMAALVAHGDSSVLEAFERPVDFSRIPAVDTDAVNVDYINNLRPEWLGDALLN